MTAPDLERSNTEARPADIVRPYAEALRDRLAEHATRVEIAGSLRRGKPMVKDVDLVALNPTPGFYEYLDGLIDSGKCRKAVYGESQKTAWGMKRRGLEFDGMKFEVYTADSDNWGYQFWLRTGPGEANTHIMTVLKRNESPLRFVDGYAYLNGVKVPIRDEHTLFGLLGMPYVAPAERDAPLYWKLMSVPAGAHTMFGEARLTRADFLASLGGERLVYFAQRARTFVRGYNDDIVAALNAQPPEHPEWMAQAQPELLNSSLRRLAQMRQEAELILKKAGE